MQGNNLELQRVDVSNPRVGIGSIEITAALTQQATHQERANFLGGIGIFLILLGGIPSLLYINGTSLFMLMTGLILLAIGIGCMVFSRREKVLVGAAMVAQQEAEMRLEENIFDLLQGRNAQMNNRFTEAQMHTEAQRRQEVITKRAEHRVRDLPSFLEEQRRAESPFLRASISADVPAQTQNNLPEREGDEVELAVINS